MVFMQDMIIKREKAVAKLRAALAKARPALMIGSMLSEDPRLVGAALNAGVTLFENNHPSLALKMGINGVTTMGMAEEIRYKVPLSATLETLKAVRNVHGDKFFITVGVAGLFTEHVPVIFTEEHALALSVAGADCLHVHKAGTGDLEEIVRIAHQYGLLVEAYLTHTVSQDNIVRVSSSSTSVEYLGIPTKTPNDAARTAKWMQDIGVDLIGIVTGMVYQVGAGGITNLVLDKVDAVVSAVDVPVVLEGGLNLENWHVAKEHNVDVIMISTSIEYMLYERLGEIIRSFDI